MGNLSEPQRSRTPALGRLVLVGASTLALIALAIAASLLELRHERELRAHYAQTLELTHLAFDAQSLASRMHALHRRTTAASESAQRLPPAPAASREAALLALRASMLAIDNDFVDWRRRAAEEQARLEADGALGPIARLRSALESLRTFLDPAIAAAAQAPPRKAAHRRAITHAPAQEDPPADSKDPRDIDRAYLAAVDAAQAALLAAVRSGTESVYLGKRTLSEVLSAAIAAAGVLAIVLGFVFVVMVRRAEHESQATLDSMGALLRTDPLTRIANRRVLVESLPVEMARAKRAGTPLAVAMLDLDFFKRYNSRRGHAGGDRLLHATAQGWQAQLRPTDILVRYGGEEFTLVLPNCDAEQACLLIERLRPVLPDAQTFSAGVAIWNSEENGDDLLRRADQALLSAKKHGRNRTMVSGHENQGELPLVPA